MTLLQCQPWSESSGPIWFSEGRPDRAKTNFLRVSSTQRKHLDFGANILVLCVDYTSLDM